MIDKTDICKRHGLDPSTELRGKTRPELEAEAAARAAIARLTKSAEPAKEKA